MLSLLPPFVSVVSVLGVVALAGLMPLKGPQPGPPTSHHIAGVPVMEGQRDWCGPAALASVLAYHGGRVSAADIARDIQLPAYRGSLNLDLLLWARARGYHATAGPGSEDALRRAIALDRPVICMIRQRGPVADRNHFVVVRGYDGEKGVWLVDRGQGREEEIAARNFDRDWAECGRWMLTIDGPANDGEVVDGLPH